MSTEKALALQQFLENQAARSKCEATAQAFRHPASCYSHEHDFILVTTASIDGNPQKFVPSHSVIASYTCFIISHLQGTPGKKCGQNEATTLLLAAHGEWCIPICTLVLLLSQNGSEGTPRRMLQLFSAAGSIPFAAIDILRPIQGTTKGNQHIVIKTDRFFKVTGVILKAETQLDANGYSILEPLGHSIWNTFDRLDW